MEIYEKNYDLTKLEEYIGYVFKDKALLVQALTRKTYSNEHKGVLDNEVLEFFGDALLYLAVTKKLMEKFTQVTEDGIQSSFKEGKLTDLRKVFIERKYLAEKARNLRIQEFMRVGKGDEKQAVNNGDKALEDTLEAIIAAIYLDSRDIKTVEVVIYAILDVDAYLDNL